MTDAVERPPGRPWHRLTVRDLPVEGGEPFTVVVPDHAARRPPVPADAAVGRIRFSPAGAGGRMRCLVGDPAAARAAAGAWLSGLARCQHAAGPCGPAGHPLVVWVDARDADAVERSLVVLGLQLLAGITASQPAPLARVVALEWLGRTDGWVMVIEGDQGPRAGRWLLSRFSHGTFAFSVQRPPQWPEFYSRYSIDVTDVAGMTGVREPGGRQPGPHLLELGMGAAGSFGENAGLIGLYASLADAALADPGARPAAATTAMADRLWAAGDYPRALRLMRSAAGSADTGDQGLDGERARLANNLACLYAAMLRPKEAIAVLEACQDRAGSAGGAAAEVPDVNLGLCHLQLADLTARHAGYVPMDSAVKARIARIEVRPENARAINEALQSAQDTAQRARLAEAGRHRDKAVTIFEALGRGHAADAESPQACLIRDCLAFSLLGAYDDYSLWPAWAVSRAKSLFEENWVWHGMISGESADATLRARIRAAVVAGVTSGSARAGGEAMTELGQALEIAGETSGSAAAQCLLGLSRLAMEYEPDDAAGYAARFAGHCLAALGAEHPWSRFAADYLELIRVQVPVSRPEPAAPYPQSLTVWEGPYAAKPAGHLEYPVVVPYLLAGDIPGAASRCYEIAAARTAQRDGPADFRAELRAAIEWRCDRELGGIRASAPGTDFSWLRPWLSQALSRDDAILELASPDVTLQ